VAYDNQDKRNESVFSKRLKAGKRRTYFFDVKTTKANDYYLTITESVKRFDDDGYDRHKLFIYKEDFNKFVKNLTETVDHVKTELMPNFDFDAFNHEYDEDGNPYQINPYANKPLPQAAPQAAANTSDAPPEDLGNVDVDKW
jgi:Protein of unknown function (DUF3276)